MNGSPLDDERDVAGLLRDHYGEPPVEQVDWDRLRATIARRAEPELARLRATTMHAAGAERTSVRAGAAPPVLRVHDGGDTAARTSPLHLRRRVWLVPAALAASVALVFALRGPGTGPGGGVRDDGAPVAGLSIDDILNTDVSDAQLRVLLSGAPDVDELLRIAAAESDES